MDSKNIIHPAEKFYFDYDKVEFFYANEDKSLTIHMSCGKSVQIPHGKNSEALSKNLIKFFEAKANRQFKEVGLS